MAIVVYIGDDHWPEVREELIGALEAAIAVPKKFVYLCLCRPTVRFEKDENVQLAVAVEVSHVNGNRVVAGIAEGLARTCLERSIAIAKERRDLNRLARASHTSGRS